MNPSSQGLTVQQQEQLISLLSNRHTMLVKNVSMLQQECKDLRDELVRVYLLHNHLNDDFKELQERYEVIKDVHVFAIDRKCKELENMQKLFFAVLFFVLILFVISVIYCFSSWILRYVYKA